MEAPLNLKDYSVNFYFYFLNAESLPTQIDPRIGSFRLALGELVFNNGIFEKYETTLIEY